MVTAMLVSCGNDLEKYPVRVPISLILSAEGYSAHPSAQHIVAADAERRRVMGDPGTTVDLPKPKYMYLFVEITQNDNSVYIENLGEYVLKSDKWQTLRYNGIYATQDDYVYQYDTTFIFLVDNTCVSAKVYAAMSLVPLSLSNSNPSSAAQIEDITFATSSTTIQENLQHIYSTPYNYNYEGHYYGFIDNLAGHVSTLNLVLYHVASRVDLMWNVSQDRRNVNNGGLRLTYMDAVDLFNGNSYLFRPLDNERPAGTTGYTLHILDNTNNSAIGQQWEGRKYFYTIPFKTTGTNYFPVMLKMRQNDDTESDGSYYVSLNLDMTTSNNVFVPWQRCLINITSPFVYNTSSSPVVKNITP